MKLIHSVEYGHTVVSATTAALVEGDRSVPTLRRLGDPAQDDATVFRLEAN